MVVETVLLGLLTSAMYDTLKEGGKLSISGLKRIFSEKEEQIKIPNDDLLRQLLDCITDKQVQSKIQSGEMSKKDLQVLLQNTRAWQSLVVNNYGDSITANDNATIVKSDTYIENLYSNSSKPKLPIMCRN